MEYIIPIAACVVALAAIALVIDERRKAARKRRIIRRITEAGW